MNTVKSNRLAWAIDGMLAIVLLPGGFLGWGYFSNRWDSAGWLLGLFMVLFGFYSLAAFIGALLTDKADTDPYKEPTTWDHWSTPNRSIRGFDTRKHDSDGGGGDGGGGGD